MLCSCGNKTNTLRFSNGKKTCEKCAKMNLSGTFLRRLEGEALYYKKDILQPSDPNFKEVYGEGKNTKRRYK
jgi:predicted ATPase with chaperone activity